MSQLDPKQMVTHLDEAKNWIDKAKEEYVESNAIRGDLNLNLAQAEMKYAWELSRGVNVSKSDVAASDKFQQIKRLLPVAAAFILVVMGVVFSLQGRIPANQQLAADIRKDIPLAVVETDDVNPEQASKIKSVKSLPIVAADASTQQRLKDEVISGSIPGQGTVAVTESVISKKRAAIEEGKTEKIIDVLNTPTREQPVSVMIIDEEELVREAYKSLRFGK